MSAISESAMGIALHQAGLIFPAGEHFSLRSSIVQGLRDIGYVIVPVDPSPEMLAATDDAAEARKTWVSMIEVVESAE